MSEGIAKSRYNVVCGKDRRGLEVVAGGLVMVL